MGITITKTVDPLDYEKVTPGIIYNRFDLFCAPGEFEVLRIRNRKEEKIVEFRVLGEKAELGIYLTPITTEELECVLLYIVDHHPEVRTVVYRDGVIPYGKEKKHNHFKVLFPSDPEEFKLRISSETKKKMRRRNRRAEEKYGKMELLEYTRETIPDEIVEAFFQFKFLTRNRKYNMTPAQYLDRYHVSHCYVVKFGDTIGAMHFCCEQRPDVYGENFSYNPELQEYSLGKFIFTHSLIRMAEKGCKAIYLSGGDYEYKTHFGSIEEMLYDCTVNVADLDLAAIAEKQSWKYLLKKRLNAVRSRFGAKAEPSDK